MISVQGLCLQYGKQPALRDVSFDVQPGTTTAIVGPSGCGKSSLLSSLNRLTDLIPEANVTGTIKIGDDEIHQRGFNATDLRRRVGMIFQKPNPFPMSVRKNIQLALKEHGVRDKEQLNEITEKALRDVGLWDEVKDRLDRPALNLSGGQQQRLCIARAIALEPEVLLMDEPCSALDPIAAKRVEELIRSLRGNYTIIIVTHNLAQARRLSDNMLAFWFEDGAGKLIEQGPTERVFTSPSNPTAAAYLSGEAG